MSDIIDISMDFGDDWNKSTNKSTNFGSGIELLMNDNQQKSKVTNNIDFNDITELEEDLDNLNLNTGNNLFEPSSSSSSSSSHVRFNNNTLGESTINLDTSDKTWDGYGKFNDIPIDPEINIPSVPKMSQNEILKEKKRYLRELDKLEKKGIQLTKKYDMDSSLDEMKGEFEMINDDKIKQNSIKFQANILMAVINGIEFLNQKFDPFDVNLEGWGEQVQENITDYDDIFAELHEKWKSKANISPELKLLFQLGGSAVMVHMTNSMFKSSLPGVDDILRQNPDLMRQFQTAAVNSMSNSNPGFSNFMSNLGSNPAPPTQNLNQNQNQRFPQSTSTKSYQSNLREQVRPDISMARGVFADSDDGINIHENNANVFERSARKEMKGPTTNEMKGPGDLTDILSGLKTKKISVNETPPLPKKSTPQYREETSPTIQLTSLNTLDYENNDSSRISVDDIKNIEGDFNVPKKSKRRPNSNKNVLDLNLDF